jgi:ABC-type transport system substrate-binding protein
MTANPDWPFWPAGGPVIDELTIKPLADENQRFNTLTTYQAQLVFTQFAPLRARAQKAGFAYTASEQEGGNTIVFNTTRAPFDDTRVRQALQESIDLQAFKAVSCECDDDPIHGLFDVDSPYYDRSNDFPGYDIDGAQLLIDEYVNKVNGGRPVEITLGHFSTTANAMNASFFLGQWARLKNVKVTLDGVDSVLAQRRVVAGQYGVHLWGNVFTDPDELYAALCSCSPSTSNVTGYKSAAMDSALNIGRASTTLGERRAAYSNLARLLNFDVPIIWYDRVPTSFLHAKSYSNMQWFNDGILRIDQIHIA